MPWVSVKAGCRHRVVGRGVLVAGEVFEASEAEMVAFGDKLNVMPPPAATDAAEGLASEQGVNLYLVRGSGTEGRILKSDVEAYLEREHGDSE